MNLKQPIGSLLRLPVEQILWLQVFFIGSLISWVIIRTIPMKHSSSLMGHYLDNRRLCVLASPQQEAKAWRMGRLMESVSKRVPWECKCLSEALCVKWLLNLYQIPSVFYLGAQLAKQGEGDDITMKAHAWVSVGRLIVVGAPTHRQYQVTATFTSPRLD